MKRDPNLRILGKRGRIYLPEKLLASLHMGEGSVLRAEGHNGALVLVPMTVTPALDPFEKETAGRKEKLSGMTARELFALAAAATAEYQSRMDEDR